MNQQRLNLQPVEWNESERAALCALGRRKAEIGHLPSQRETAQGWRDLNDLKPVRPRVWINEIPWRELEPVTPALQCVCRDPFLALIEQKLRRELYQWDHFACDMVVEPHIDCPIAGGPSGVYADYGLEARMIRVDGANDVLFEPIIQSDDDVAKIRTPEVWYDTDATQQRLDALREIFEGVIPVVRRGIVHQWHTPWDMAVRWYGVERLFLDMFDHPERVAAVAERLCQAAHDVLDRQEALGMLDVSSGNYRVGSGGLGFTRALPTAVSERAVTPRDQWGCGNAQIFSEVSPAMHEEFSLRFERPVMERFGLSYYGCCEPLHNKIDILSRIANLRKISMSPKANLRQAAEACAGRYVLSLKPNPACMAGGPLRADAVRAELRQNLADSRPAGAEIILKDITTVENEPSRLDQWAQIAMDVVQSAAP